jgi:TonB family protein
MRIERVLFLALALPILATRLHPQGTISVDEQTLAQHVEHQVEPVYPPIAKAAHIQGTIVFEIRVGVSGKIESMKVVSGPAMLQQAATDCLKQWTFHPFEKDGAPVPATGQMSIIFTLSDYHPGPKDEQIADRYFPLSDQCRKAVSSHTDPAAAAQVCKQAADLASEFGPDARFIEKRSAFVWAAWAFIYSGDSKNALYYASKAVEVVELGHDDNAGNNAAYGVRGIAEGKAGDFVAADRDLAVAEDFGRKGIAWMEKEAPSLRHEYTGAMILDLRFHAQMLQALNRPDEAQKKLDEAERYK